MTIFGITQLINSIVLAIASFILFNSNRKSPKNRNIAATIFCIALWCFFYFIWQTAADEYMADYWLRVLMVWVIWIPYFINRFVLHFLEVFENHKIYMSCNAIMTLLFSIGTLVGYLNNGVGGNTWYMNYTARAGPLFGPMITFFAINILYSLFLLFKDYKNSTPLIKQQIKYTIFGIFFAYIVSTSNYALWFEIQIPPFGNFLLIFFLFFVVYSMTSKHLIDIKIVLGKSTVKALSFSILIFLVLLAKLSVYRLYPNFWLDFLILLSAILIYPFIKKTIYNFSHKYLFTTLYDSTKVIQSISEKLNSTLNIKYIYEYIYKTISDTFYSKGVSILLFNQKNNLFKATYSQGFAKKNKKVFSACVDLMHILNITNCPILVEELKNKGNYNIEKKDGCLDKLFEDISFYKIDVLVPMKLKNKIIGILVLGRKTSEEIYNDDDLKVLKAIGEHAALSIENARLYSEVDDFNKNLQKKVNEQTRELREKAEHMKKLMAMRSEFLDIVSHQLRTPVSVIKGVLSMIEEGSIPANKQNEFINGALEKSIKLGEIINDILRASEMDSEEFMLHNKPTDLNEIFKKIKEDKIRSAVINKVKFNINLPTDKNLPAVLADSRYLEHAIINLINNAIQYTPNGSVDVNFEIKADEIIIRVADTGIGIPKENLPKLFQKFSRAENAVEAYADGSGLGLFIVKQIVDATPGSKVEIENSELNKGTTIALSLPIAKDSLMELKNVSPSVTMKK